MGPAAWRKWAAKLVGPSHSSARRTGSSNNAVSFYLLHISGSRVSELCEASLGVASWSRLERSRHEKSTAFHFLSRPEYGSSFLRIFVRTSKDFGAEAEMLFDLNEAQLIQVFLTEFISGCAMQAPCMSVSLLCYSQK
jgi:hypothetical protein